MGPATADKLAEMGVTGRPSALDRAELDFDPEGQPLDDDDGIDFQDAQRVRATGSSVPGGIDGLEPEPAPLPTGPSAVTATSGESSKQGATGARGTGQEVPAATAAASSKAPAAAKSTVAGASMPAFPRGVTNLFDKIKNTAANIFSGNESAEQRAAAALSAAAEAARDASSTNNADN